MRGSRDEILCGILEIERIKSYNVYLDDKTGFVVIVNVRMLIVQTKYNKSTYERIQ